MVVILNKDIESLKGTVDAFAEERSSSLEKKGVTTDLEPKPLARALSYICERFDHPVSPFAIEHTTVFADNKTDVQTLPVIGCLLYTSPSPRDRG